MRREQITDNREQFDSMFPILRSLVPIIDLQWFSDDNDEDAPGKTLEPTETKLKKLRDEGQVAKSQELVGAIGLILPALVLLFLAPSMLKSCVEMVRFFFTRATEMDATKDSIILGVFFNYFIRLTAPLLIVAFIAAIISNMAQIGGWLFTVKPITPDFSKAIPKFGSYFKRVFSMEGLFNLGKSIAKILIIGAVAFLFISGEMEKLVNLQKSDPYTGLILVAGIAIKMILVVAILLIVLSIGDFYFQRYRFRKRHMMTPKEMHEEHKQHYGDPSVQQRIRSRFRELLRQSIAASVPKADVVITNPTHLAIALMFDASTMKYSGPMVVAKGEDEVAARIREIAQKNEVPLVENKPLAWALYRETKVGDFIREEHWLVVAKVLQQVSKLNEERRRNKAA